MRITTLLAACCAVLTVACGDDDPKPGDATSADSSGDSSTTSDSSVTTTPDGSNPSDATTQPPTDVTNVTDSTVPTDATTSPTDATTNPDTEVVDPPPTCDDPIPAAPAGQACGIIEGSDSALLIRADLVLANGIQEDGQLLIINGLIACVGCDCAGKPEATNATVFNCPDAVVSPGLVNAHDHVTYSQGKPKTHGTTRYDHRNEWRQGLNGKPKISGPSNASPLGDSWAELRQVMGGTTSYFASGAAPGLVRNLDTASRLENLTHGAAEYDTFPLGSSGIYNSGCGDYEDPNPNVLTKVAFVPHVAEGVAVGARNEFICIDGQAEGSVDFVEENTAFIHGIGATAADIGVFVGEGASLVWSPRSNTDLYGFTAEAPLYHKQGGRIALGSDWSYSGSLNILRELRCAQDWNTRWNNYFSDQQLVNMVTTWGAAALGFDDVLGSLTVGKIADIAIWDGREHEGFKAILDADVDDVLLTLRGGTPPSIGGTTYYRRGRPMYGDPALVAELTDRQLSYSSYDPNVYSATDGSKKKLPEACEIVDVCGVSKRLCVGEQMETKPSGSSFFETFSLAELKTALTGDTSELFPCNGVTPSEPSCLPARPGEFTGVPSAGDTDGDGIPDATDKCPTYFSAVRPLDNGQQPDTDADGLGDVCDPCPFDKDTTACTSVNPDDIDGDGVLNDVDKCPNISDDQTDTDGDGIGDACDACPTESNIGGAACSSTIVKVKTKDNVDFGDSVRLAGVQVVTVGPDFFTVQQLGAADPKNTGLYVFTTSTGTKPTVGQIIDLTGTVTDYFGQNELTNPMWPTTGITTAPLPAPVVITPADIAVGSPTEQAYEALLVEIRNVTVSNTAPTPNGTENVAGEFDVTAGGSSTRVDDALFAITPPPTVGQTFGFLRGVTRYNRNRIKLLPRSAADVDSGPPQVSAIVPADGSMYALTTGGPFSVRLTSPARGALTVTVDSSNALVATAAAVVFAEGDIEKPIVVNALVAGNVTLTAHIADGTEATASLQVVAPGSVPAVIDAETDSTVQLGEDFDVTVTLDLPAPAGGQVIEIETSGSVSTCTALTIPAGQYTGVSTCTATSVVGTATVTFGTTEGDATVQVAVTDAPPAAEVVFCFEDSSGSYSLAPNVDINTTAPSTFATGSGVGAPADVSGSTLATKPDACTSTSSKALNGSGWPTGAARDNTKYYEIKVAHGSGRYTLAVDLRSSNTGPKTIDITSSTSGNLVTAQAFAADAAFHQVVWTGQLTGGADSIRVYAYGAGAAAGTFRIDNVHLFPAP